MYVYLAIALLSAALSGVGAWKVQNWRFAAQEKERIEAQAIKEAAERVKVDAAATNHETDKVRIRTVTKTIIKEVDRAIAQTPFYAADAPACLDADGVRLIAEAATGRAAAASEPAPAVPGIRPSHWWQPRRDAPVER